jgi:hypothetical protein
MSSTGRKKNEIFGHLPDLTMVDRSTLSLLSIKTIVSTGRDGRNGNAQRRRLRARLREHHTGTAKPPLRATELRSRRRRASEGRLRAPGGGCFPPPRRRSDRCHHRRGRTTELGPRSTSTAATDGHCFLLAPATVALAHSVQQGRIASLCFFCLPRAAAPARLVCPRETRLLGDLSFNPTSFAGPFRFSLCPVVQSAL